jgi:hypothetical protein
MTLTETAQLIKRGALVLTVVLLAIFTGRTVWSRVKPIIFPPRTPPPEVAFGKLPTPTIPNLPFQEGARPKHVVDTKTGRLPTDLPESAGVYKIILPSPTHLVGERAKELAANLGFSGEPQKLSRSDYFWEKAEAGRSLRINIITEILSLTTDLAKLSDLKAGSPPSKAAAIEQAGRLLSGLGLLTDDYLQGRKEAIYLKIVGKSLSKVENLAAAHLVRVDFFREVNDYPIVTPNPYEGLISVILGKDEVAFIDYTSWPIDPLQSSTYPLKTAVQIWSEVEQGRAQMVSLVPMKGDPFASYEPQSPETIFVRQILLGYFDAEKFQNYLQPVYILEGLALTASRQQLDYIAYIPAVANDWVAEKK